MFYNVRKGYTTRCTTCGGKAAAESRIKRVWKGRKPDEIDQMIRGRWFSIRQRCRDPLSCNYKHYGGRGITMAPEFEDPLTFINYVKALPGVHPGRDIGRIDNDKGYEPGNLEWQTIDDNAANKRNSISVMWEGKKYSARSWAVRYTKYSPSTVGRLVSRGLSPAEIIARQESDLPGLRPRKRRTRASLLNG